MMPDEGSAGSESASDNVTEGSRPLLFTFVCPNPSCQVRNRVFDEGHNICFNCGWKMFLTPEEREARWYEEAGRRRREMGGALVWMGLGLCLLAFLGVPLLIDGIVQRRRGKRERQRGEEMNRAAGRRPLARTNTRWVEMNTRAVSWSVGPEGPRPKDYDFEDAGWIKPFSRIYYLAWIAALVVGWIVTT